MDFRLAPNGNTVSMSFFKILFEVQDYDKVTRGNFMMFLVYLVLVCFLVFGLMMFHNYSVAMLVSIFVLYPFFVKISIKKSISHWI